MFSKPRVANGHFCHPVEKVFLRMKSSQRKADIISTLDPSVDPFLELSIMCSSKFPLFLEKAIRLRFLSLKRKEFLPLLQACI